METKQTAVDYLLKQISARVDIIKPNALEVALLQDVYYKAKEMEKEQIEKAFQHSMVAMVVGKFLSPEQYYNETYNK